VLEEFQRDYRPLLRGAATSPFLFLSTLTGGPYKPNGLRAEISATVALHTGKRFYPHLIRTIWATEYLLSTPPPGEPPPSYATAGMLLGDTTAMVIKAYQHLADKDHHARARSFVTRALHPK